MKDLPILFSAPMVRAIMAGKKTQTRRVVKPQPSQHHWDDFLAGYSFRQKLLKTNKGLCVKFSHWLNGTEDGVEWVKCPYGQPENIIWVRETFSGPYVCTGFPPSQWADFADIWYWADGEPQFGDWTIPKPSIHMPRKFSRLTLKITDIRVERLQDITREDAKDEGIPEHYSEALEIFGEKMLSDRALHFWDNHTSVENFQWLWDSINGKPRKDGQDISWQANPLVWVIEFERVET